MALDEARLIDSLSFYRYPPVNIKLVLRCVNGWVDTEKLFAHLHPFVGMYYFDSAPTHGGFARTDAQYRFFLRQLRVRVTLFNSFTLPKACGTIRSVQRCSRPANQADDGPSSPTFQ
jgi:hypothetical protein